MRSYATTAPDECIFDFEDERTAAAAYYALRSAGIEAVVVSAGAMVSADGVTENRGPRVVVTPKDAERAAALLSQPSTDALKGEPEETPEEFRLPRCPACGGEETLLESVDPVNQWRCDDCGHTWLEESQFRRLGKTYVALLKARKRPARCGSFSLSNDASMPHPLAFLSPSCGAGEGCSGLGLRCWS